MVGARHFQRVYAGLDRAVQAASFPNWGPEHVSHEANIQVLDHPNYYSSVTSIQFKIFVPRAEAHISARRLALEGGEGGLAGVVEGGKGLSERLPGLRVGLLYKHARPPFQRVLIRSLLAELQRGLCLHSVKPRVKTWGLISAIKHCSLLVTS